MTCMRAQERLPAQLPFECSLGANSPVCSDARAPGLQVHVLGCTGRTANTGGLQLEALVHVDQSSLCMARSHRPCQAGQCLNTPM